MGGTTHNLLLGVDPFVVIIRRRWSDSFLACWRHCGEILPLVSPQIIIFNPYNYELIQAKTVEPLLEVASQ